MKTLRDIDYSPLNKKIDYLKVLRKITKNPYFPLIVFIAILICFISIVGNIQLYLILPIVVGIPLFFISPFDQEKYKQWENFAKKNGWELLQSTDSHKYVPPSLLGLDGYVTNQRIVVELEGQEWHLFTYDYETSTGKYRETIKLIILHKLLPKNMPYIALNSIKNRGGIEQIPEGCRKVSLEGDFDEYFNLYIQEGSQIDVLSIISPDIMKTMIENSITQDIEIIDNNIYFISKCSISIMEDVKNILASASTLYKDLLHRLKTLKYDPSVELHNEGRIIPAISAQSAQYVDISNWKRNVLLALIAFLLFIILIAVIFLFSAVRALP